MILNGIEITPESLKAQLEEQGLRIVPIQKPSHPFKVGDLVWSRGEITETAPGSYVVKPRHTGVPILDELVQAYDELYVSVKAMFESGKSDPMPSTLVIKIRDIKSRTAGK